MGAMRVWDGGSGKREGERATSWLCVGDKETVFIRALFIPLFHIVHIRSMSPKKLRGAPKAGRKRRPVASSSSDVACIADAGTSDEDGEPSEKKSDSDECALTDECDALLADSDDDSSSTDGSKMQAKHVAAPRSIAPPAKRARRGGVAKEVGAGAERNTDKGVTRKKEQELCTLGKPRDCFWCGRSLGVR